MGDIKRRQVAAEFCIYHLELSPFNKKNSNRIVCSVKTSGPCDGNSH